MSSPIAEIGRVISNTEITTDTWDMSVEAPRIAELTSAGQFVHVRVGDAFDPFLRRPLSVGPIKDGIMRLIYTTRGRGTKILADKRPGIKLDMIGPLGKTFPKLPDGIHPIFVSGGIGVVPLLLLDYQMADRLERTFLLGVRSNLYMPLSLDEVMARRIKIASDDGSLGFHGNVVQLLSNQVDKSEKSKMVIYACGPGPMMKALKDYCYAMDLKLYVSLEVSMGCGLGACQSCAVPKSDGSGYFLVCKDGPVFPADEIDLAPEMLP
ncbi:dihydroorotate dehydrogenase electron transfer subunit [Calditrichota bacterium]